MPDISSIFSIATLLDILIKSLFVIAILKTLEQMKPDNKKLSAPVVWLLAVPYLSLVVSFYVAVRLSQSLKNELIDRDFDVKGYPLLILGLAFSLIAPAALLLPPPEDLENIQNDPNFIPLAIHNMASVISFIWYWMKINWYKRVLIEDSTEPGSNADI